MIKNNTWYTEKYYKQILRCFAYKVVCGADQFSKPVVAYRGKNAINSFEKYFFKVMNNSTFSKAKKILRKRINVRLINNARGYIRYGNKLRFVSQKISSKNFVAIYEVKPVLTLDKSI